MYNSSLTNPLTQTYLYKWFDHSFIIPFWLMLLEIYTCTSDFFTKGRNLMYHSFLTYTQRQTYLYKWFDHTLQELNVSLHSDLCTFADILLQLISLHLAGTNVIIPFWPMLLGRYTCTQCIVPFWTKLLGSPNFTGDLNTLGWYLMYRFLPTYALSITYLYKCFDHTRQEINVPFHSD